jgi:hypothetical protein
MAEQFGAVGHLADEGAGVGVEEQLARIAAQAVRRLERARHAVPVRLAGAGARYEPVPYARILVLELQLSLGAVGVEQAQRDSVRDGRGDREVHAVVARDGA